MKAPFPYFGGKRRCAEIVWQRFGDVDNYVARCSGHEQSLGCLPHRFVALLVDHLRALRTATNEATAAAAKSGRWMARCSALLTSCRFAGSSFSLFPSMWWIPKPRGTFLPVLASHETTARNFHKFGSATFTNARAGSWRLCLVRCWTLPTGSLFSAWKPLANLPCCVLMPTPYRIN